MEIIIENNKKVIFDDVEQEDKCGPIFFFTDETPLNAMVKLSSGYPELTFKLFYNAFDDSHTGRIIVKNGKIITHRLRGSSEEDDFTDDNLYTPAMEVGAINQK